MKNQTVKEKPLLQMAFEILVREMGPEKTTKLWQVLFSPKEDYLNIRKKLFKAKPLKELYQTAKKFNR